MEMIGQPLMRRGDYCIFDTKDGYEIYKKKEGLVQTFDREKIDAQGDAFWRGLESLGWEQVPMTVFDSDDDYEDDDEGFWDDDDDDD